MAQVIPFPSPPNRPLSGMEYAKTELHNLCDQYAEILGALQAKITIHSGCRQVGVRIDGGFPEAPVIVRASTLEVAMEKTRSVLETLCRAKAER